MLKNNAQNNASRRAFTLVELIVVTSIFGLLSSVVLVSVATSRVKAQDARTLANFDQMRLAFESYYNHYGGYPNPCYATHSCGSNQFYCIGNTNCKLLGQIVSTKLALAPLETDFAEKPSAALDIASLFVSVAHAADFPEATTPSINTTATIDGVTVSGATQGFVYLPCDTNTPTCFEKTSQDLAPTYQYGVVSQTLGTWEKLNYARTTSASILDNFTNPTGPADQPGVTAPGTAPGSFFPDYPPGS